MHCANCSKEFTEPALEHTTYEAYYGVSSDFRNNRPLTLEVYPYCHSEEIEMEAEYEEA